jgi:hypothetical protein
LNLSPHALDGARCANVIVELGKASEYRFEQFSLRLGVDGLSDGDNPHAVLQKICLDVEVIADIAGQAVHLPNEKLVNVAVSLSTEVEQLKELGTVSKLGRLATLYEDTPDI